MKSNGTVGNMSQEPKSTKYSRQADGIMLTLKDGRTEFLESKEIYDPEDFSLNIRRENRWLEDQVEKHQYNMNGAVITHYQGGNWTWKEHINKFRPKGATADEDTFLTENYYEPTPEYNSDFKPSKVQAKKKMKNIVLTF